MAQLEAAAPAGAGPSKAGRPAISARDLRKRYGSTVAIDGLSLDIRSGECLGLLGPNGAGKTTTIEILEGLTPPDSGSVEVLGMTWEGDAARIRPRLGIQLQETRLTGKQRVQEVVALFRSFFPNGPNVDQLLDRVQLTDKRKSYVRDLSGGQKQRLSVACALAGDPDILFLDEPTTGLDPQSRRSVWDICQRFQSDGGTIVITTHFMDEAERLCDRVAIMDHGRILVEGAPKALIDELAGEHTIEFEADMPLATDRLEQLPSVQHVVSKGKRIFVTVQETHRTVPALMDLLTEEGGELSSLATHRATLDDVFLALTGRQLRDE